jgi:predicted small secreted protein
MQQLPLVIFALAMAAFVVTGCILTRKPKKGH